MEGNFEGTIYKPFEQRMMKDAYDAVTEAEAWEEMKGDPGDGGFMYSSAPHVKRISAKMKFDGHSGASFGLTLRVMQYIAREGWGKYYAQVKGEPPSSGGNSSG